MSAPVEVKWDDGFGPRLIGALNQGVSKMAAVLQAEMTATLNTQRIAQRRISRRSGRVYWVGPGSPPGTPPFIRSGRLKGSIDYAPPARFTTHVGSSMPYARRLEYGFVGMDSRGRQYHDPPRPWARPSVVRARPVMVEVMGAHLRAALPRLAVGVV